MSFHQLSLSAVYNPTQPSYRKTQETVTALQKKVSQTYISEDDMRLLKIECTDLEFDPEPQTDDGLLKLMSMQEMRDYAKQHSFPAFRPGYAMDENFHRASYVFNQFITCLHSEEDPERETQSLDEKLSCVIHCPYEYADYLQWYGQTAKWKVEHYITRKDSPHVVCLMADNACPREDALLLSEVYCILSMAFLMFIEEQNAKYEIIPVTLISGSGTYFRIVHGYADREGKTIQLRKTRIVDVGEGEVGGKIQQDRCLTLMRWVVATLKTT
ncbi:hypothetical protein F4861DRAFT_502148 [Xylaria intraflava]|nr:hypothetical protein F4861DRAFT_502148 [Xylaria intraflava]